MLLLPGIGRLIHLQELHPQYFFKDLDFAWLNFCCTCLLLNCNLAR